ncbi:transposase [Mesorhizobium sp. M0142]|uniref:transposase n=1 Tax=Mesorhizobium sp. M0142 TaxID=2956894 RepID=UPI0033379C2B
MPRQYTSGGKERLGRVSEAGQTDIRSLLISGAMSRLTVLARKSIVEGSWLARMLRHKPLMLVAIALANKMALDRVRRSPYRPAASRNAVMKRPERRTHSITSHSRLKASCIKGGNQRRTTAIQSKS